MGGGTVSENMADLPVNMVNKDKLASFAKKRPSIRDIAKLASVSPATVSRVFNNHPLVKKSTAEKILGIAEKLNYRPNTHGRVLRSGHCRSIGILLAPVSKDFLYSEVVTNNLTWFITNENYAARLEFMSISPEGIISTPGCVQSREVDGLIIVGHTEQQWLEKMRHWGVPICLANGCKFDHNGFYSVTSDFYRGASDAVQYLAALGRRKIAFVHGTLKWPSALARYKGYVDTVKKLHLECPPEYIFTVNEDQQNYQGGYVATMQLLEKHPELDAIFYINDWYAVGGICATKSLGRKIPEDLNLMGYDNTWIAQDVYPGLTTINLQVEEICHRAIEMLIRAIEKRPEIVKTAIIPPKLVVRETTSPIQSL